MITSYVCLRCRQQIVRRSQVFRCIGFVSLSQAPRTPKGIPPSKRKPLRDADLHGPKTDISVKSTSAYTRRSYKRVYHGEDAALEALFVGQQEEQRKLTRREDPKELLNPSDEAVRHEQAHLPPEGRLQQSDISASSADHHEQIIKRLGKQEKQLAHSIAKIRESLGFTENKDLAADRLSAKKTLPLTNRRDDTAKRVTTIIKDIERAVNRYDIAQVHEQWEKYQENLASVVLDHQSQEVIYTHFLTAFFTLHRQEQAVNVWNHMLEAGIVPNARHWNAMLKGCFKAQDAKSLQEVWSNIKASGVDPDMALWTSYIHGLIVCGKWERGLQALDELGAKWRAAAKRRKKTTNESGQTSTGLSSRNVDFDPNIPSLAPVHAAITALTMGQRHELCFRLLDWAKSHSLILNNDVFNTLLRPAVRSGETTLTARIFALMKANNCSPDAITYTILFNGHISGPNTTFALLPPEEQRDSIFRILDDMSASGMAIDQRTYSTILGGLLSPSNIDHPPHDTAATSAAAQAVLEHMSHTRIRPDSYIYHMLVTYYFSLRPSPDLPAIDTLWTRIQRERPPLQSIFYEKMVEGYASVGEVEKMLFFLRRIVGEGKSPRWRCLGVVLGVLVRGGEWGLVRELVRDVEGKDGEGGLMRYADGGGGGAAKEMFWDEVERVRGWIVEEGGR